MGLGGLRGAPIDPALGRRAAARRDRRRARAGAGPARPRRADGEPRSRRAPPRSSRILAALRDAARRDDRAGGASSRARVAARRPRAGARRRRPPDRPRAARRTVLARSGAALERGRDLAARTTRARRGGGAAARSGAQRAGPLGSRVGRLAADPRVRGVRFGFDRGAAGPPRHRPDGRAGRAGRARRRERQRQDDAAPAGARACSGPIAGEVRLGGRDPCADARRSSSSRLAGYVVQDPELGFLADTVREEVELGLDAGAGPLRPRAVRAARGCRSRRSATGARTGSPAASSAASRS